MLGSAAPPVQGARVDVRLLQQPLSRAQRAHVHANMQRGELDRSGPRVALLGVEVRQQQVEQVELVPAAELVQRREAKEVGPARVDLRVASLVSPCEHSGYLKYGV